MLGYHDASSALTLLVLLVGASSLPLSTQIPINAPGFDGSSRHRAASPGLAEGGGAGDKARRGGETSSSPKGGAEAGEGGEEEDDDELFKDVDPKTLAAVLLEALNKPQAERRMEGGQREGTDEEKAEPAEVTKGEEKGEAARAAERANRGGRHELELVMAAAAAQGKEEREREEAEERKRKQEEEERMTERVTSRTTSQTVPVKTKPAADPSSDGRGEEVGAQGAPAAHPRPAAATGDPRQSDDEEEEQLSPEEVQSLERMMKKFQSYSAATKRERDSQVGERESRGGFSPYNDIQPTHKGGNPAMSKKKLKWQEETQKAMHVPTFKGGNFMDDFQDNDLDNTNIPAQRPPSPENDVMEEDEPEGEEEEGDEEEEEEEEEALSPAEEEARAKAEQEEVRRQAAEAQRAKMEEEKLADIASDMLLQYMVKQNGGNRKYRPQSRKYSSSQSNAAEDKRSDEEQEVMDEDDDIDPQTIDKLIEISSKLHLPADDVVDIISDVEKKKKKDVAHEMAPPPPRQRPLMPMSSSQSSSSSVSGISASQMAAALNGVPSSKQDPQAVNPLKAWFLEKPPAKSPPAGEDFWSKPRKPLSTAQDFWLKPQKSFRGSYTPYSPYASYYQQKPYRGYYPIYYPPPPKAKPRYYLPKPALTLNNLLGSSAADYDYNFAPRRRFRNWVQVRPRKAQASLRRNPYYADYVYSSYPRTFQPAAAVPLPQLRSPPRLAGVSPRRSAFYYRPPVPVATRGDDYYDGQRGNQADGGDDDDRLESYIQQILMKRPQMVQ